MTGRGGITNATRLSVCIALVSSGGEGGAGRRTTRLPVTGRCTVTSHYCVIGWTAVQQGGQLVLGEKRRSIACVDTRSLRGGEDCAIAMRSRTGVLLLLGQLYCAGGAHMSGDSMVREFDCPARPAKGECCGSVFLAGVAKDAAPECWKAMAVVGLAGLSVAVWNSTVSSREASWNDCVENAERQQRVEWERQAAEQADVIIVYFYDWGRQEEAWLEWEEIAKTRGAHVVVCSPEEYEWNWQVEIAAQQCGAQVVHSLDEAIAEVRRRLERVASLFRVPGAGKCIQKRQQGAARGIANS
jgi:hypothetical protein